MPKIKVAKAAKAKVKKSKKELSVSLDACKTVADIKLFLTDHVIPLLK